jgi:hypothetical protein
MFGDNGIGANLTECSHSAEQGRFHERHVPRDNDDRRAIRAAQRCLDASEWAKSRLSVGEYRVAWKPGGRALIVRDDEDLVRCAAERGNRTVGDALLFDNRESLGEAAEAL